MPTTERGQVAVGQRRVLVLGLGNTLLSDEGVGVQALDRLHARYELPGVTLQDGGTMGLEALPYLEAATHVLVLDAVQTGAPPGTLVRLVGEAIPAIVALKLSMHQVGLQEALAMARLRGTLPSQLVLLGIVPAVLDWGLALSPAVAAQLDALVEAAAAELAAWGLAVLQRARTASA
jgi:hydrogenase maturation protease